MTNNPNDLYLAINGQQYYGWSSVRFTRSCEQFPSQFEISLTQKSPTGGPVLFQPFQPCQVYLGSDLVMTGFLDTVDTSIDAESHSITLTGRSKCEDLVDCSGEFLGSGGIGGVPNMQGKNQNVVSIATELCKPYGLTVTTQFKSDVKLQNQGIFAINPGETGYEIIERFAKFQGVLVFDGTDGNLILATVGYSSMASGFSLGQNIQSLNLSLRFDQRYSIYDVFDSTVRQQSSGVGAVTNPGTAVDGGIKRHRRLILISETVGPDQASWKEQRVNWEKNRRYGRSQIIRLKTDSWRDAAGTLWQPNAFAPVDAPYVGISGISQANWIISDVTFAKDLNEGTTAELTLMPEEAFSIEPTVLTPLNAAITEGFSPTGSNPTP